jgi:hypothetical protein
MRWPALPSSALVTPVLHVEVSTVNPPTQIENSRAIIIDALLDAAAVSTSGWVQLDTEAKPSQRVFYRSLVQDLRTALPQRIKLSVTALAWWCRAPAWLDGLAADEVVPMFFRMGKDSTAMRKLLEHSPTHCTPAAARTAPASRRKNRSRHLPADAMPKLTGLTAMHGSVADRTCRHHQGVHHDLYNAFLAAAGAALACASAYASGGGPWDPYVNRNVPTSRSRATRPGNWVWC